MIRPTFLAVLVLGAFANPCFGEISLEDALEGFGYDDPNGEENEPSIDSVGKDISNLDDILGEFESQDGTTPITTSEVPEITGMNTPSARISGSIRQKFIINFSHDAPEASNFDYRGLSSMSTRLDLSFESKFPNEFRVLLTGHFLLDPIQPKQALPFRTVKTTSSNDYEMEIGEAFIQGPLSDSMDLTLGRQILVWGRSDQFRVTDILNPVDNRMPGLTDVKDLRLPVTMARLDLYSGPWTSSFILVPERRFDRAAEPGSDYYFGPDTLPPREYSEGQFGKPDLAFALTGTFSGWDLSFYSARLFSRSPYTDIEQDRPKHKHQRITMLGSAANLVVGSWLMKTEIAVYKDLRFSNLPDSNFQQITALAGVEYSGIVDTTLALEFASSHISDFDKRLLAQPNPRKENETTMGLRIGKIFLNDSLDLSMAIRAPTPIGNNGGLVRTQATYNLNDSVELYGGTLLYFRGESLPYRKIADNDRLFFGLNYYF